MSVFAIGGTLFCVAALAIAKAEAFSEWAVGLALIVSDLRTSVTARFRYNVV